MKGKKKQKQHIPTIKCECGYEFLLIPDSKAMGKAIENHVLEHKNKYGLSEEEAQNIEESLIAQVFNLLQRK